MPAPDATPPTLFNENEATTTSVEALRDRFRTLLDETLPSEIHEPIRFNHCFARVVLDWLCGDVWYDHIGRPAYQHLTAEQLTQCIDRMERWRTDPDLLRADNASSLRLRGKLPSGAKAGR